MNNPVQFSTPLIWSKCVYIQKITESSYLPLFVHDGKILSLILSEIKHKPILNNGFENKKMAKLWFLHYHITNSIIIIYKIKLQIAVIITLVRKNNPSTEKNTTRLTSMNKATYL